MHRRCLLLIVATTMLPLTLGSGSVRAQSSDDFVPVTDAMLHDPAPADWLMWRRTLNSWGYSPLDQIDRENVGEIRMGSGRPRCGRASSRAPRSSTTA